MKMGSGSEPLGRRPKIKSKGLKSKMQVNLLFRSPCTNFNLLRSLKIGGGSEPLGRRPKIKSKGLKSKMQVNLLFRSPCTIFVSK